MDGSLLLWLVVIASLFLVLVCVCVWTFRKSIRQRGAVWFRKRLSAEEEECAWKKYLDEIGYIGGHTPVSTDYRSVPKWVLDVIKRGPVALGLWDHGLGEVITFRLKGKTFVYKLEFTQCGSYLNVFRTLRR